MWIFHERKARQVTRIDVVYALGDGMSPKAAAEIVNCSSRFRASLRAETVKLSKGLT